VIDLIRSVPNGMVETVITTFGMLIAVQFFEASPFWKTVLLLGAPAGLLSGLFLVSLVRQLNWTFNRAVTLIWSFSGVGFAISALSGHNTAQYVMGVFCGVMGWTLSVPFMTQMYREYYPTEIRGRLFSIAATVRKAFSLLIAWWFGWMLANDISNYTVVMWTFAGCSLMMAVCGSLYPTVRVASDDTFRFFGAFRHLKEDKAFRNLILSWLLLGFGNLMPIALFVEFISNPDYGHAYPADQVALLTTLIPEGVFMVTVFGWGLLFDRLNFYFMRALINIFFAVSIIIYYLSGGEFWLLALGIGLHGFAKGGGNVAWSLWTTKFSKPEHVAEYMSVHTFFTGIRATLAPIVAISVSSMGFPVTIGVIGAGLIVLATLMLIPDLREQLKKGK